MADAVTSQTLIDGDRKAVMKFTNVSDGTGEAGVLKVDVSTLSANAAGKACDGVAIERIHASLNGMAVNIIWDADTDVTGFVVAPGTYTFDFTPLQLTNNAGAGVTGDVRFTTIGHAAGDTYTIVLEMVKSYAS